MPSPPQNTQDHNPVPVTNYMVSPESVNTQQCWQNADVSVGIYDPNKWYTVVIPITAFVEGMFIDPDSLVIKDIMFEGGHLGEAGMTELPTVYLDDIWWVEGLEFPLKRSGDSAYDTPISSVQDHVDSNSKYNCRDEWVVAYTGEVGHADNGESPRWSRTVATGDGPAECVGDVLRGYAQDPDDTPFSLAGQYELTDPDNENGVYLFYDGHSGYDYPAPGGTGVYAVADGIVIVSAGETVVVDHQNGYTSHYLHLSDRQVGVGTQVVAGETLLADVASGSAPHLHFTMKLYGMRTDPYGWLGTFDDPSRAFVVNVPLWK